MEYTALLELQRAYFESGATLSYGARLEALRRLKAAIEANEQPLYDALHADLGKSPSESYMTEVGFTLAELSFTLSHLRRWMGDRRRPTPISQFCARSFEHSSPYGVTLIMSPWNYPVMLTLTPLIASIAAGNTAVVKPSAYSPATSQVLEQLLSQAFDPEYVAVVTGGRQANAGLLEEKFDYIFFTGGKVVGRLVLEKAAVHLTPVTLELGGKSPCIVDETANLKRAAARVAFGKYLNCGQTCVAPDYLLVQEGVKDRFLALLKEQIVAQYGKNPLENGNYGKIITEKHFRRITKLYAGEQDVWGGQADEAALRIAPAVVDGVTWDSPLMGEEIFGPVLPVLTFRNIEEIPALVNRRPTPLALYLFTTSARNKQFVVERVQFGGGCINDTIIHLATSHMGFGGVGESGMGSYHGKRGFDTFSHTKSIVDKANWLDLPMRYQPYTPQKDKMVRRFLK